MPRLRLSDAHTVSSRLNVPVRIPLNDDREEKAKRLLSRQAFHEAQMNSLKAAASPAKKRRSLGPGADGPLTPSQNADGQDGGLNVAGAAVTPMKRIPILANFEEWMKMATDNKINANNSWNFALIDYFHDMSLLKEGDGVNFQKASCTLDGCVKIYTSRVDSVATETGKLLSGLADSGNKKPQNEDGAAEDGEEGDEDEEDGSKKRTKKKSQRSHEATLATSFSQLQLKKMELEFAVDPLFKKASADFDEGGAKGLLLNHLCIDNTGRIVFDSSDDAQDHTLDESRRDSILAGGQIEDEQKPETDENAPVDVAALAARFFPDISKLDHQDVCPSLKTFELGSGSGTLDLPFLKADDWKKDKHSTDNDGADDDARSGIVIDEDNADGFDDVMGGFDLPPETGFGEGGEAWAREAHIVPQIRPLDVDIEEGNNTPDDLGKVGTFDARSKQYGVTLVHREQDEQENILSYFDTALRKNWAGPEHWKIQKIKDAAKPDAAPVKRKEKEPFEIDFAVPMTQQLADMLYTKAPSNASINLPKIQWKSRTRNLLPDDKHFNSRDLLRLFLKPKARIGTRRAGAATRHVELLPNGEVDEVYWAQQQGSDALGAAQHAGDQDAVAGAYDANFFQDDGLPFADGHDDDGGDDVFDDAPELPLGSEAPLVSSNQQTDGGGVGAFGTQLVMQSRRLRPEYVQYARVAKKVDVRRLKEEMWRGIGFETLEDEDATKQSSLSQTQLQKLPSSTPTVPRTDDGTLKFTDVVNNLRHVYPQQAMADISTSYCFICLLHLANEKGLTITNQDGFQELSIKRDFTADVTGEA